VFSPLKRALAAETDTASRLHSGRISRTEWTSMYIRARQQALKSSNLKRGFKATGLWPLSPITVLKKLDMLPHLPTSEPHLPTQQHGLDLSLLQSDPPDGTELREANASCIAEVQNADGLASPVKRYISRLTRAFEATCSKNTALRKENTEQRELLQTRKKRNTGKRVALKGKFVFSTQEVLEIAREAEKATAEKGTRTRRRKVPTGEKIEQQEDEVIENRSGDSDSDCIVVVQRK
jgi:hypothetical protein